MFHSLGELGHPWECVCVWSQPCLIIKHLGAKGLGTLGMWRVGGALPTWDSYVLKGYWAEGVPMQRPRVLTQHMRSGSCLQADMSLARDQQASGQGRGAD